jgi:GDP-L-fucose synthase
MIKRMKNKKILLTGATGFVGKNIHKFLKNKYDVIGIGSEWDLRHQINVAHALDLFNPDIVIHAAGSVGGIGANKDNPGKFLYDNLIMGTHMIQEAKSRNLSKFIMLGTVCSYPKFASVPFKEEDLWLGYPEETNAPYGIAKKTLMNLVETYKEQYGFNGINLIPVNMYGPHDHFNLTTSHVIPALILKVKTAINNNHSSVTVWGSGSASREFLYVEDLARAIELGIETDVGPSPINIGTGSEISIKDLVNLIADLMGYQGDIVYDNSKPDGQPRRCLDTSKAKKLLGFEAKIGLVEGLKKTIKWYEESINNGN